MKTLVYTAFCGCRYTVGWQDNIFDWVRAIHICRDCNDKKITQMCSILQQEVDESDSLQDMLTRDNWHFSGCAATSQIPKNCNCNEV